MNMPPRFEVGDTKLFSAVYSVAPAAAPLFNVFVGSLLVASAMAITSGSTLYYAFFTIPDSSPPTVFAWTFTTSFNLTSCGLGVQRGLFEGIKTATW